MNRHAFEQAARPVVAGLLILVTLMAILGLGIRDPRPHDIPIGTVVRAPVATQLAAAFDRAAPGAFGFTAFTSESDARAAIDARTIDAALIVGPDGPRLVVAGAAGDAIAAAVSAAFTGAFQAQGQQLELETVHAFQASDPHGIVLFFLVLATIVAAAICGASTALAGASRSASASIVMLVTYALLAGITSGLLATWLADGYASQIVAVMAVCGLLSLAVASAVTASGRLLGPIGVAIAVLAIVPVGLVSSGGPLGSEFLPDAYRALAPWLPVAPAYGALRGVLFFGGAAITGPLVVLAGWVAAGIIVLVGADVLHSPSTRPALAHA